MNNTQEKTKNLQIKPKNESEEDNESIIELEITTYNDQEEIYILCDRNELIKENKRNENVYKKIILIHQKYLIVLI